jgi:hypothetical protein
MKRTMLTTILAMSFALGASRADVPAGTNKAEKHQGLAEWTQVAAESVIAAKDPAGQQIPVRLNVPGNDDREKPPLLVAPLCPSCIKNSPFSPWQQLKLFLSMAYWV